MDELIKSPQGQRDLQKYSTKDDNATSMFSRPQTDNLAIYTGCTACVVLITENEIYCANAGDSRCVLSKDGSAIEMSYDHKPNNTYERMRIEKAGGYVEDNRVNGVIALSRAFGDLEYKQEKGLNID